MGTFWCSPCAQFLPNRQDCRHFADETRRHQRTQACIRRVRALDLVLTHDALHPGEPFYLREALAAHGVEADHVKVWQTVGKLGAGTGW